MLLGGPFGAILLQLLELVLGKKPILFDAVQLVLHLRLLLRHMTDLALGRGELVLQVSKLVHEVTLVRLEPLSDYVQLLDLPVRVLKLLLGELYLLLALKTGITLSQFADLGLLSEAGHLVVKLLPQRIGLLL